MAYRVKKFRGYRRMLRKLIRVVEDYQPDWRPDEADGREEFLELDLYSHRFFHPRGKGRKALFSALLRKTEALIAAKPADLPFCKIFLFMPGGDLGQAEIVLIYDRERFETFWLRTDPADGLWTLQKDRSLLTELGLSSTLPGAGACWRSSTGRAMWSGRCLGYGRLPCTHGGIYEAPVIINPAAGSRRASARLETLLSRLSFPHEVAYTREAGDAQRLAATAGPDGGAGAHLRLRRGRHPQRGGQRGGGL